MRTLIQTLLILLTANFHLYAHSEVCRQIFQVSGPQYSSSSEAINELLTSLNLQPSDLHTRFDRQLQSQVMKQLKALGFDELASLADLAKRLRHIPDNFSVRRLESLDSIGHEFAYGSRLVSAASSPLSHENRLSLASHLQQQDLYSSLQHLYKTRQSELQNLVERLIRFDELNLSSHLILPDGSFSYQSAPIHTMVDILEKMDAYGVFDIYLPNFKWTALAKQFSQAIRKTRADHYQGRNQQLKQLTLLEAKGTFVGVGSEATAIPLDRVISSRRFLAGNAGAGLWAPSSAVGHFTKETSFFPIEALYGPGASRKIFWVLNDHKRHQSVEGVPLRSGWGNADLTQMRVVVNYAKDDQGRDRPVTLETLVPSPDPDIGAIPFFFKNINDEWVPQTMFTFPGNIDVPVETACFRCHAKQSNPAQLSPVPGKVFSYDSERLKARGGYNPEIVDAVLQFLEKPF